MSTFSANMLTPAAWAAWCFPRLIASGSRRAVGRGLAGRKRRCRISRAMVAWMVSTVLVPRTLSAAGQPNRAEGERVLFEERFNEGLKRWRILEGRWRVSEGECVSAGPGMCAAKVPKWKDFSVQIRLKTEKPGDHSWDVGALMFRFTERKNPFGGDYYYLLLHKKGNLELGKRFAGKQLRGGLAHVREVPPATTWTRLRVEVRGGFIRVFVNDSLVIECVDSEPIREGGIGLLNLGAPLCRFDDVRVTTVGPVRRTPAPDWPGRSLRLEGAGGSQTGSASRGWPMYGHNPTRNAVTEDRLVPPLRLRWSHTPLHPPRPAWPEPCREKHRLPFDYVFHVAVGSGLVCFGSSADHQVHALDADTGEERWHAFTEGPVRFAPVIVGNRVFAASDDGCVYCLSAEDGALLWRFRGGPRDERIVGNDQVIARWPVRSGVLVDGDTVYFAAGMWSSDGVYVYALRASDGSVIWVNDTCARLYMKLPHDYLEGIAGVSPQGYMLLSGDVLIVPNGRAMPAAFDRKTGALLYCRNAASKLHHPGGAWNIVAGDLIIGERHPLQPDRPSTREPSGPLPGDGLIGWAVATGEQVLALAGKYRAVISRGVAYLSGSGTLTAIDTAVLLEKAGQYYYTGLIDPHLNQADVHPMPWWRGARYPWYPSKVVPIAPTPARWEVPIGRTYALAIAGDVLIASGDGRVDAFDVKTGKALWNAVVPGQARGLAAADGRLYVSTTTGAILCFSPGSGGGRQIRPSPQTVQVPPETRRRAKQILDRSGITAGFCLILGAGDGSLPLELAGISKLNIVCLEPDARAVAVVRERLAQAGVYGERVALHHGELSRTRYADYFANLVVVPDTSGLSMDKAAPELYRVLHPWGGAAVVFAADNTASAAAAFREAGVPESEIRTADGIVTVIRGPLPGAGLWTHEYGDAARSSASTDVHVRLPLKMLWFGGPGPAEIVSRHWRSPAPLFASGRLFIAGENCLIAVDAYNGRQLWTRDLPGVARFPARYRGGNIVADESCVYAVKGTQCFQFDARTGRTLRIFSVPATVADAPVPDNPIDRARGGRAAADPRPNTRTWEYLAVAGRYVLGSVGVPNLVMSWWPEAYPECHYVFALDKHSGETAWVYRVQESVSPNAVVVSGGRVWLLDRTSNAAVLRTRRRGRSEPRRAVLRCLNVTNGASIWNAPIDPRFETLCMGNDVLLACRARAVAAWNASDGKPLWNAPIRGEFPVIIGNTLYAYPGAYDLRTGQPRETQHPLTGRRVPWRMTYKGGCGAITGCRDALFYRSGAAGMVDIRTDSGIQWLGQVRPSCWINMIPAGGMLLIPEGASGCTCPYNYQTSVAMVANTDENAEYWSVYPELEVEPGERLRHVSLNFGAVGDRRDEAGVLWLTWPRPVRPGGLFVPLTGTGSVRTLRRSLEQTRIDGTKRPWLYASACAGAIRLDLELALDRPAVALPCKVPPRIDGRLDDPCWDGREPLWFTDDRQIRSPGVIAWLRADSTALYLAFRRKAPLVNGKPVPWTARTTGEDAPVWRDDSLNIRLRRGTRREGLYLSVSASGARFDGRSVHRIGTDPTWNGSWRHAVRTEPGQWCAEIAIPWKTLRAVGINRGNLSIYLQSDNATGIGPKQVHYRYRPYTRLWCFAHRFVPVAFEPPPRLAPHGYDLALHFIETDDAAAPGERVFDVVVDGKTVITGVDPVREAGAPNRPLVRRVSGVRLNDQMTLELVPKGKRPPILCGIELREAAGPE